MEEIAKLEDAFRECIRNHDYSGARKTLDELEATYNALCADKTSPPFHI